GAGLVVLVGGGLHLGGTLALAQHLDHDVQLTGRDRRHEGHHHGAHRPAFGHVRGELLEHRGGHHAAEGGAALTPFFRDHHGVRGGFTHGRHGVVKVHNGPP